MELPPERYYKEVQKVIGSVSNDAFYKYYLSKQGYYPSALLPNDFKANLTTLPLLKVDWSKSGKIPIKKPVQISTMNPDYSWRVYSLIHPELYKRILREISYSVTFKLIKAKLTHKLKKTYSYSMPAIFTAVSKGSFSSASQISDYVRMTEKDILETIALEPEYNYLIKTDIQNCYGSIYTHSIAWAIHGIDKAKNGRNNYKKFIGNRLDKLFQNANNGETVGLPIGPIISDVVYELIMKSIATELEHNTKDIDYICFQFKDDLWFLLKKGANKERLLFELSSILQRYKLSLNRQKLEVIQINSLAEINKHKFELISGIPQDIFRTKCLYNKHERIFPILMTKAIEVQKLYPRKKVVTSLLLYFSKTRFEKLDVKFRKEVVIWLLKILDIAKWSISSVLQLLLKVYPHLNIDDQALVQNSLQKHLNKASADKNTFGVIWIAYFFNLLKVNYKLPQYKTIHPLLDAIVNKSEKIKFETEEYSNLIRKQIKDPISDFINFNLFKNTY